MATASPSLTVAGPSHVIALRHAVETGQTTTPRRPVVWHETGGYSALSPYFRDAEFARSPGDAIFLVPDFRIGNRLLVDPDDPSAAGGIDRDLIDPERDARIFGRTMEALHDIRKANPRCRFLLWSLAGREHQNRSAGRYVTDGVYRHPTWNLAEVEAALGDRAISLQGVVDHPRAAMLYVDGGSHPSWWGLELLRRLVDDPDADAGAVFTSMLATLPRPVVDFPSPTLVSGASRWISTLYDYASRGLLRIGPHLVLRSREELFASPLPEVDSAFYLSHLGGVEVPTSVEVGHLREILDKLAASVPDTHVFLWDYRARPFTERGRDRVAADDPLSWERIEQGLREFALPGTRDAVGAADVEKIAPDPQATLHGVLALVRLLGGGHTLELV